MNSGGSGQNFFKTSWNLDSINSKDVNQEIIYWIGNSPFFYEAKYTQVLIHNCSTTCTAQNKCKFFICNSRQGRTSQGTRWEVTSFLLWKSYFFKTFFILILKAVCHLGNFACTKGHLSLSAFENKLWAVLSVQLLCSAAKLVMSDGLLYQEERQRDQREGKTTCSIIKWESTGNGCRLILVLPRCLNQCCCFYMCPIYHQCATFWWHPNVITLCLIVCSYEFFQTKEN